MLELKDIYWSTPDGTPILNGLNLTIPDGKLVVVTGPNGGGKTTLAKIIAGIEKPAAGKILLDGEDITELGVTERANKGVSFAFQQPVRFKGITVRRLIELAANRKLPESEICNSLSRVGLCARDYIDREVNATLSGGEIKRIEIATVLARHTNLSVFDEPEAGIDLWSFTNLIQVFEKIRHDMHGTMMIISHQERILKIADEIAVVAEGTIKSKGPAEEVMGDLLKGHEMRQSCSKQEEMFNE